MDKQFLVKMQNINNTTLFSSKSLTSPWLSGNETSSIWYSGPEKPAQGIPTTSLFELLLVISLLVIQCALLHPKFKDSSSARLTRLSLGPLIIGWALLYPFRLPVVPFEERDILHGFLAVMMIFKSIEFTFASGPYHMRGLKTVEGVPVWEKDSVAKPSLEEPESGLGDLALWTALLFTSQRGLRWSWGPVGKGNESSFLQALLELVRLQMVLLPCVGFVLYSQDWTTYSSDPRSALLSLGIPSFRGLGLVAGAIHSACTMLVVSSSLEMFNAVPVLLTYPLYPMAKSIGLSPKLYELLNPANYPPQFGSLFDFSSLANFWGKSWHQKFRRAFLFCGGKPAMSIARALGGSKNVQKACGAMGVFALSGFLHEYPLYAYEREPHPYPRQLFKTLPTSFLYFFVQSFGVILEPIIIPYIPKRLGGAKLWTISFLFLTAPLFTRDACRPGGPFNRYRFPQQWTWLDMVIPAPFAEKLLSSK
ncbi:hypothetical protein PGT21_009256 [Puccinia graminis f. sp. tritici]|uniref:Wax synthase domain-containing protein n=2 Tax=Puccinia graminis f. sp. tritici TaxID=56615 RepID=E3K9F4_PUCGT|nr:uncharacterized protein PGTG_07326 [Puccinia graminis f. sp. tritici CRL 75-36-700-3]EFP81074.2 hypothetical protein PGTG_07326 [Puccinia graminis f. sp. tritici CRL 75-36-700-3]KAA1069020.1 hypothetical protein PGT21_009256 [Puccinia graminis f. sp. tritici]